MKKLRISFAAIIAIVAIGLTVAAQAGAFEAKRVITNCFIPDGSLLKIKNPVSCPATPQTITASDNCPTAQNPLTGFGVWSVGSFFTPTQRAEECIGGAKFCCFTVTPGSVCGATNPELNLGDGLTRYVVQQVYCKP